MAQASKGRILYHRLPGFVRRSFALFVSVVFLSESTAAIAGRYPVKMAQQPAATQQEATRAAAERAYQEGMQLYRQGTAESRRQAIRKWEEALQLYRAVGDKTGEAVTLSNIGAVYNALGEKQKALYYFNQSLPLSRQVGNKAQEAATLNNIGAVYNALGEKQKALAFYNQSLPLSREVGDKAQEATTLNNIGRVYDALGEKQKALDFYNQSLPLSREVGDKAQEAITLNNIGRVYSELGEKQKALNFYNQSLPLSRQVGDKAQEATTLNNIGGVYSELGEKQKALDYYNQSLPLRREVGDKAGVAVTLNNIGGVYDALGEKQKALDFYNQSLPLSREVGDKAQEATTLNNIGGVYSELGEKQKALDYYNQSLPLIREVGYKAGVARTLNNIGLVYSELGEKQKALDYYNQSLPLSREVGDKAGVAVTLNNIGLVYSELGEKQKALDYYNQSLPLSREVGYKAGVARTLNSIGFVYSELGEKQKALDYYNQSLPLSREVGDKAGVAVTLNNIGLVYDALGEKQKALDYYNQSLPLSREVGDKAGVARTLNNIGSVYYALGEKQKALDYYNQSLPLRREVGDKAGVATTLNNIGGVYSELGEKQKALDFYNQSLPLSREVGNKRLEATTLSNFAKLERSRGNLNQALTQIEAAIEIIEDLRTKIGSQELRASYFATVQDYYEFYIDLLMQLHKQNPSKGYDAQALHANERAKARSLLELLIEANADIRQGVDPKLLERERNLQQQLDAREKRRIELLSGNPTDEQKADLNKQIEDLLEEYRDVQTEIRAKSPRYANLKYPQPLTLAEIQKEVLDEDTVLLEYSLGKDRSYLWLVTKTGITSYELPKRADIEAAANQFRRMLTDVTQDPAEVAKAATQLSQIVLAPVASQLGEKRLLIVADDVLQYIPFAALSIPVAQGSTSVPPVAAGELLSGGAGEPGSRGAEAQLRRERDEGEGKTFPTPHTPHPTPHSQFPSPSPSSLSLVPSPQSQNTEYQPLIVKHEIVNSPSASTIAISRRELKGRTPAPKTVVMLADPVFSANDDRLKSAGELLSRGAGEQGSRGEGENGELPMLQLQRSARESGVEFDRLKFTRQEAEAIMALVPQTQREQAFDFDASRIQATNPKLGEYRILHFATHGIVNTTNPELSGLVMSLVDKNGTQQNGFLRLNDIFNLNLPAELVVLSACETGSGKAIRGEGLVGLTRGFMYAGSPRVIASLWSVNDPATAELMTKFYQHYLKEGLTPAAALRSAQLEMSKQEKWQIPYFWAAFTMQGEWR